MASPDDHGERFWNEMAAQFGAPSPEGWVVRAERLPHDDQWGEPNPPRHWVLTGPRTQTAQFRRFAGIAAVALGVATHEDAWRAWLDVLRDHGACSDDEITISKSEMGLNWSTEILVPGVDMIDDVYKASAEVCQGA